MSEPVESREFSICLIPDDGTTTGIQALREKLPKSPYRVDRPHTTLLRGITTPGPLNDNELVGNITSVLQLSAALPLTARVVSVLNASNRFYASTGGLLLDASPGLIQLRQRTINKLLQNNYAVEQRELETYTPHITVQIEVPLEGDMMASAQSEFLGRDITFESWLLFTVFDDGGKRIMHEVYP